MASTYSPLLRLELIAAGEQAGLWGNTTNSNLGTLLEQAIAGTTFVTLSSTSAYTLSNLNGTVDESRAAVLVFSGTTGGSTQVIVPTLQKLYIVKNATPTDLVIKTAAQVGGVTLTTGNTVPLFCDGTSVFASITPGAIGAPTTAGVGATGTWGINITGNAATVTNGVYQSETSNNGGADKLVRYGGQGNIALGSTGNGTWDDSSTSKAYGFGCEFGQLGAIYSGLSVNGLQEFWYNGARCGMMFNGYYQGGSVRNKSNGNGYGGRVSAFEMYSHQMRWAFSDTAPTGGGAAVNLTSKMQVDFNGALFIAGSLTQSSDRRLKKDIKKLTGVMDKVAKLSGYTYDRTDMEGTSRQIGLMADEVKAVFPEAVTTGEDGYDRVAYANLVAPLIECVKSQAASIAKLQERCRLLEAKVK